MNNGLYVTSGKLHFHPQCLALARKENSGSSDSLTIYRNINVVNSKYLVLYLVLLLKMRCQNGECVYLTNRL